MTFELFETDWRELWAGAHEYESVGAVFTRPEIVDLILDLAGYDPESLHLADHPLLEPSCGDGAFLVAVIARLMASEHRVAGQIDWHDPRIGDAVRAADINPESVAQARSLVRSLLTRFGASDGQATALADRWVIQTDFLLHEWSTLFDFVIGNPPYVRIEDIPKPVLARYRARYETLSDRADLYIAFFERGLELLSQRGTLSYICANRFTKNQYGERLRKLIARKYHVRAYVNLEHTQPFLSDVSAYPAIIVLDRRIDKPTRATTLSDIEPATLDRVRRESKAKLTSDSILSEFKSWYAAGEPWIATDKKDHSELTRLAQLPMLEDSAPGTKVGIGVATGADKVFILKGKHPEIEETRQIPLLVPSDVGNEALEWSGHYLLNPFADADDGSLVDLDQYPGFAAYINSHAESLRKRHVAKGRPTTWFRTIDRIWPSLRSKKKLMIPDIQKASTIGLDEGRYYPHHNIYWVTSEGWPLEALKTLLRSDQVYRQVAALSVQMRGGNVRFQAQTLRRIRVPSVRSLPKQLLGRLASLSASSDQAAIDAAAEEAFRLALGS